MNIKTTVAYILKKPFNSSNDSVFLSVHKEKNVRNGKTLCICMHQTTKPFLGAINICSKQKVNNFRNSAQTTKLHGVLFMRKQSEREEKKKILSSRIFVVWWLRSRFCTDHHSNDYLQNFWTLHIFNQIFIYLSFSWLVFVYLFVSLKSSFPFILFFLLSFLSSTIIVSL